MRAPRARRASWTASSTIAFPSLARSPVALAGAAAVGRRIVCDAPASRATQTARRPRRFTLSGRRSDAGGHSADREAWMSEAQTMDVQQTMDCMAQPTKQHEWLQRMVGEWTGEIESQM